MNLTRAVVKDLLPVYLAGEASADTRALVEDYLKGDPALAREVEGVRRLDPGLPPTPAPAEDVERRALEATRRRLRDRTSTLAVATFFTALPLAFATDGTRVTFLLIRDAPIIGLAWWFTAAVLWICYFFIRRRLQVSGL
jgi:anti-sigma factor RsiW